MLTDLEICLQNKMDKIEEIAKKLNLDLDLLENYGKYKAKICKGCRTGDFRGTEG